MDQVSTVVPDERAAVGVLGEVDVGEPPVIGVGDGLGELADGPGRKEAAGVGQCYGANVMDRFGVLCVLPRMPSGRSMSYLGVHGSFRFVQKNKQK